MFVKSGLVWGRVPVRIAYLMVPAETGTAFTRVFGYRPPRALLPVDRMLTAPHLRREAEVALRRLRAILEREPEPSV